MNFFQFQLLGVWIGVFFLDFGTKLHHHQKYINLHNLMLVALDTLTTIGNKNYKFGTPNPEFFKLVKLKKFLTYQKITYRGQAWAKEKFVGLTLL